MKKILLSSCLLVFAQIGMAEDYLLDSSTMAVGTTAGENLVVKEGCLDPSKTSCSEKFQWLTSKSAIKIGNLQVIGQVIGDFEVIVTADFEGAPIGIQLLTADNKGISLQMKDGYSSFKPNEVGEGGDSSYSFLPGWNSGYDFNEIKIIARNGVANVYTNGQVYGNPVNFDPGIVFERVAIEGITADDRISEVKVRGIQTTCATNPTSGNGTVTPVASSQLPTIAPNLNMHIPSLEYQSLGGKMNLWVDLKFTPTDDDKIWWVLDNYGVNP